MLCKAIEYRVVGHLPCRKRFKKIVRFFMMTIVRCTIRSMLRRSSIICVRCRGVCPGTVNLRRFLVVSGCGSVVFYIVNVSRSTEKTSILIAKKSPLRRLGGVRYTLARATLRYNIYIYIPNKYNTVQVSIWVKNTLFTIKITYYIKLAANAKKNWSE